MALAEWQATCQHLGSMGLLAAADKTLLERYAMTYARLRRAEENMAKSPSSVPTSIPRFRLTSRR